MRRIGFAAHVAALEPTVVPVLRQTPQRGQVEDVTPLVPTAANGCAITTWPASSRTTCLATASRRSPPSTVSVFVPRSCASVAVVGVRPPANEE